ncbi:MAG: hypothetical protein WC196_03735 [Bacilli bacterium]|nr:hypothetical protein [Bacilli bacterium]MDD3422491.1 hypothetical protein [Bacilli bacterium]MDD4065943.1 hypothetical protein [Bacilli bacterium]
MKRKVLEYERDTEGRVIVNMVVKDDSNFLSVFSENKTPVISSEVADFIESCTNTLIPGEQLTLRIHSDCIDDQEKEIYRAAIKEYYSEKNVANERERVRNNTLAVTLFTLGVIVLAIDMILKNRTPVSIWAEVIDIVAWVLLWEAVDITIFRNHETRNNRKHYSANLNMKIEYVSLKENKA